MESVRCTFPLALVLFWAPGLLAHPPPAHYHSRLPFSASSTFIMPRECIRYRFRTETA